jgi:alpha-L-arabinofuranosidase
MAALSLNIFNRQSDRVVMTNIAQMVNVLQAVILTSDEKMVLTPTYHVYDLFKAHQDAMLVECITETGSVGTEIARIPQISVSASINDLKALTMRIVNASSDQMDMVECLLLDKAINEVSAYALTGRMNAYNSFEQPDAVRIEKFGGVKTLEGKLIFKMPQCGVLNIEIK